MRAAGVLLVFCLFSSILSTMTSLKCETCVAFGEACGVVDTKVVECKKNEEFCSTVVFKSNISISLIVKDCSTREDCVERPLTTTIGDGKFEISRANCCQSDGCNAEPLPLPNYDGLQPNGLQCPRCYSLDDNHCKVNETVFCIGQEDQCITVTSTIEVFGYVSEKNSYQECTTKTTCSIPLGWFALDIGPIHFNIIKRECRNASSSEPDLQG